MPLTLEEITEREDCLRREIAERERLLGAYQLIRADRAESSAAARLPASQPFTLADRTHPAPEILALPSPPSQAPASPNAPAINPMLSALAHGYGGYGNVVSWAIQQMIDDYTLKDVTALLKREGYGIHAQKISVVLSRLKTRGEIEEITRGGGRRPAVFRKPVNATAPAAETTDVTGEKEVGEDISVGA